MIVRRYLLSIISASVISLSMCPSTIKANSLAFEEEAKIFVEEMADKAIRQLTDKSADREIRIEQFRTYFTNHFAVAGIGKWILGRHWRKATMKERSDYLKLFEDLMVISYVDRFASYTGEPLNIKKSVSQDSKNVTVFSEINQKDGNPAIRVDWRVARKGDLMKIVDVVVEGTSMSNTLRSDFGSIIRSRGRKISGLLEALREKTSSLREKKQIK